MQNKFSIYLTGFRKNRGTQHALLKMIETWKTKLDMGHKVGVIYMDLSKAFDCLSHELLIAKLKCYGLDQHAVEFFRSYLLTRYQCCKVNKYPWRLEKNYSRRTTGIYTGSFIIQHIFK